MAQAGFIEGAELFAAAAFNINKAEAETMVLAPGCPKGQRPEVSVQLLQEKDLKEGLLDATATLHVH